MVPHVGTGGNMRRGGGGGRVDGRLEGGAGKRRLRGRGEERAGGSGLQLGGARAEAGRLGRSRPWSGDRRAQSRSETA